MTVQAARKGMASGSKRKQRRRRGAPAATNVSTSELQDLYNERQVRGIAPNFSGLGVHVHHVGSRSLHHKK